MDVKRDSNEVTISGQPAEISKAKQVTIAIMAFNCLPLLELTYVLWLCR